MTIKALTRLHRTTLLGTCIVLAAAPDARATQPEDDFVVTAGTVVESGAKRYGYLLWHPARQGALRGRAIAVYRKGGDAASAALYSRVAIVREQHEPHTIASLLERSTLIGQGLGELEGIIDALFEGLLPDSPPAEPVSLESKLSTVIRGSGPDDNPDFYRNLLLLARLHSGVGLCVGRAFLTEIPANGKTTFELRGWDPASNKSSGVIGRLTLDPAAMPRPLPAPGAPLIVDPPVDGDPAHPLHPRRLQNAARAYNRAVSLRWSRPDDLRDRSPLHFGYNLYRVPKAFAEAQGWHLTPPGANDDPAFPTALIDAVNGGMAARVNGDLPILTNDAAAPDTAIITDNNRRFAGGPPLENNSQYYYFVTARDLLGRDGEASVGTQATICNRQPPTSPTNLEVDIEYDDNPRTQRFRLRWDASETVADNGPISYYIYRWRDWTGSQRELDPDNPPPPVVQNGVGLGRIGGPVLETSELTFLDDANNPPTAANEGLTYWYTIRACEQTLCGKNWSRHSPPFPATMPDRSAPAPVPGSVLWIPCAEVSVSYIGSLVRPDSNDDKRTFFLKCGRDSDIIQWVEFALIDPAGETTVIGHHEFPDTDIVNQFLSMTDAELDALADDGTGATSFIACRVGTVGDVITDFADAQKDWLSIPDGGTPHSKVELKFQSNTVIGQVDADDGCPGTVIITDEPCFSIDLPDEDIYEARIYCQVDDGPPMLVKSVETGDPLAGAIEYKVEAPAGGGEVRCFVQLVGESGIAGPMTPLTELEFPPRDMPKPLLLPIKPVGTPADPKMKVRWVCPPEGVDHFEFIVSRDGQAPGPATDFVEIDDTGIEIPGFRIYRTGRIEGSLAGDADPLPAEFELDLPIKLGSNYTLVVRAVARFRAGAEDSLIHGRISNIQEFLWEPVDLNPGPDVKWPSRPVPEPRSVVLLNSAIRPVNIHDAAAFPAIPNADRPKIHPGFAVRIGFIPGAAESGSPISGAPQVLEGHYNPNEYVHTTTESGGQQKPLFPCALYRYRIIDPGGANEMAGDLLQVSPMMESIAHEIQSGPDKTVIHDPFIRFHLQSGPLGQVLLLVDTQPMIKGEAYAYVIVRFDPETKEISDVLQTGSETVPINP